MDETIRQYRRKAILGIVGRIVMWGGISAILLSLVADLIELNTVPALLMAWASGGWGVIVALYGIGDVALAVRRAARHF